MFQYSIFQLSQSIPFAGAMGPTHRPFGPMARFLVDDLGKGVVIVVWGVTFPQLRNVQVDHPPKKELYYIYIYILNHIIFIYIYIYITV